MTITPQEAIEASEFVKYHQYQQDELLRKALNYLADSSIYSSYILPFDIKVGKITVPEGSELSVVVHVLNCAKNVPSWLNIPNIIRSIEDV